MHIKEAILAYALGGLFPDALPKVGLDALEAGYDSPSLRQLAVCGRADPSETVQDLFRRSVNELGLVIPTPPEAGLAMAKIIAQEVLAGRCEPYDGARRIWGLWSRFPELEQLTAFVGLASEYEDDEVHRDGYVRDIIEECRRLSRDTIQSCGREKRGGVI